MSAQLQPGFYWVRFDWGWEPARWDGNEWLRAGIDRGWNDHVREIGYAITHEQSPLLGLQEMVEASGVGIELWFDRDGWMEAKKNGHPFVAFLQDVMSREK